MKTSLTDKISSAYQTGKDVMQKSSDKIFLSLVALETLAVANTYAKPVNGMNTQVPSEARLGGVLFWGIAGGLLHYMSKNNGTKMNSANLERAAYFCYGFGASQLLD